MINYANKMVDNRLFLKRGRKRKLEFLQDLHQSSSKLSYQFIHYTLYKGFGQNGLYMKIY